MQLVSNTRPVDDSTGCGRAVNDQELSLFPSIEGWWWERNLGRGMAAVEREG